MVTAGLDNLKSTAAIIEEVKFLHLCVFSMLFFQEKFYKSSLTNLEKMLKQKSSEILMLQKQLKAPCMKNISTSLTKVRYELCM